MRVRLNRSFNDDHGDSPERARLRLVPPREESEEFADERRLRDAGGPDDNAQYHCSCGYIFEAPVSTGVSCPHCGASQAW
ncbi:MAG TPA: hypothetical protein VFZ89_13800 [Solirubrobacteraceae bacterium]